MKKTTIYDCTIQVQYFDGCGVQVSTTTLTPGSVDIEITDSNTCSVMGIENLGLLSWRDEDMILADKECTVRIIIRKSSIQETADLLDRLLGGESYWIN